MPKFSYLEFRQMGTTSNVTSAVAGENKRCDTRVEVGQLICEPLTHHLCSFRLCAVRELFLLLFIIQTENDEAHLYQIVRPTTTMDQSCVKSFFKGDQRNHFQREC